MAGFGQLIEMLRQDPKTIVLRALSEEEIQVVSLEGFDPEIYEIWMQEGDIFAVHSLDEYFQIDIEHSAFSLLAQKVEEA